MQITSTLLSRRVDVAYDRSPQEKYKFERLLQNMKKKTKPGEKGFPVLLLLLGIFITSESWKMYQKAPELQGYGTVPLICGALLTILSLLNILTDLRMTSEIKGLALKDKAVAIVKHLLSPDVLIMALFIIIYCIAMSLGLMFEVASMIFLWGSMMVFHHGEGKKSILKNLIYSALVLLFVIVVFHVGFHVVLP